MLTKGDDYPIHQTPEPIAFAGTDRNFNFDFWRPRGRTMRLTIWIGSTERALIVVDWQTVGVWCGATDIAYYLGSALDPIQRRQVEDDPIAYYCRHLSKAGVMDCYHADIWNDYRRSAFARFTMGVTASMVVEQTERGDTMFLAMCE